MIEIISEEVSSNFLTTLAGWNGVQIYFEFQSGVLSESSNNNTSTSAGVWIIEIEVCLLNEA